MFASLGIVVYSFLAVGVGASIVQASGFSALCFYTQAFNLEEKHLTKLKRASEKAAWPNGVYFCLLQAF